MLTAISAGKWKADCTSVLIERGVAYDIRVDAQSIQENLGLSERPDYIGMDVAFHDQDAPLVLRTEGWSNEHHFCTLFGDAMNHAFPTQYGMLSLHPIEAPQGAAVEPLPRTLKALYGELPRQQDIEQAIGKLSDEKLADLEYWAACQGTAIDATVAGKLMGVGSPLVRENCLAMLYFTKQDAPAIKAAVAAAYQDYPSQSSNVLILANLLNEKYAIGHLPQVRELAKHADLTVAFSAARALAAVGTSDDVAYLEQVQAESLKAIQQTPDPDNAHAGQIRAVHVFTGAALASLKDRVEPIRIPASTAVVERQARNMDLPRLMSADGNHVYNAQGLLRSWPQSGPKELWRVPVGVGKAGVTEVAGKAYTAGQSEGKQWALCLDARTGKTLWRQEIYDKEWKHIASGPLVTPLVDEGRVYFGARADKGYDPIGPWVCLNAQDGTVIWRSDESYFCQGDSTPLIVGDTLYSAAGWHGDGQILVALDKKTGKRLWSVRDPLKRPKLYASSASPTYQVIDGIPQIIFGVYEVAREVWGVSAKTGEVFWTYPCPLHHSLISSPVAVGSRVFVCGGQGASAFSACLQMYVKDGKIRARQLYRSETLQCNMYNTVAVLDGSIYGFSGKSMQCTSLEDGTLRWEQKAKDWGTDQPLIVADGLIYALSIGGDLVLVDASPAGYRERGRVATGIKLGIPQQPTLANGRLYIRGDEWVVCYDVLNAADGTGP